MVGGAWREHRRWTEEGLTVRQGRKERPEKSKKKAERQRGRERERKADY